MPIETVDDLYEAYAEEHSRGLPQQKEWTTKALRASGGRLTNYELYKSVGSNKMGFALLVGPAVLAMKAGLKTKNAQLAGGGKLTFKDNQVRLMIETGKPEEVMDALNDHFSKMRLTFRAELITTGSEGKPSPKEEVQMAERESRAEDIVRAIRDFGIVAPEANKEAWNDLRRRADEAVRVARARNPKDVEALEIEFGKLEEGYAAQERADAVLRKKQKAWVRPTTPPPEPEREGSILMAKEDIYFVFLDSHQNKHQHPNARIGQLKPYGGEPGSKFSIEKDLGWHQAHSAQVALTWAKSLRMTRPGREILPKEPLTDGYIYDASAVHDGYYVVVEYHCNPTDDE